MQTGSREQTLWSFVWAASAPLRQLEIDQDEASNRLSRQLDRQLDLYSARLARSAIAARERQHWRVANIFSRAAPPTGPLVRLVPLHSARWHTSLFTLNLSGVKLRLHLEAVSRKDVNTEASRSLAGRQLGAQLARAHAQRGPFARPIKAELDSRRPSARQLNGSFPAKAACSQVSEPARCCPFFNQIRGVARPHTKRAKWLNSSNQSAGQRLSSNHEAICDRMHVGHALVLLIEWAPR